MGFMFKRYSDDIQAVQFFIPLVMFVIGGLFASINSPVWKAVGAATAFLGAMVAIWLYKKGLAQDEINKIKENHFFYAEVMKLDDPTRYQLGLAPLPKSMPLTINKTDIEGNAYSVSITDCPIDPWKMKIIAAAVLAGRKFTIREWTPETDGKLLSDPKWRELIAFLKQPIKGNDKITFIEQRNPGVMNSPYDFTPAGKKWLESIVDHPLIENHRL